jgi:hypothetical protein
MQIINVVITGSRDWQIDKAPKIWEALEDLQEQYENDWHSPEFVLHHGVCPFGGADLIGASWARGAGWIVVPHPPIKPVGWAFAKRNQEMIDLQPDYVIACFLEGAGNKGTQMTVDMAVNAGLKDRIIEIWG